MCVCCESCVLSGRSLCDELITRPEESHRLRCIVMCDLETSRMRRLWPALGHSATKKIKDQLLTSRAVVSLMTGPFTVLYIYTGGHFSVTE